MSRKRQMDTTPEMDPAPPRRRSSFFKRQSIVPGRSIENVPTRNAEQPVENKDDALYKQQLMDEIDNWKTHIRERKASAKSLEKRPIILDTGIYDTRNLPQEDIDFLNAAPDYEKIEETTRSLRRETDELLKNGRILKNDQESRLNEIEESLRICVNRLLENS